DAVAQPLAPLADGGPFEALHAGDLEAGRVDALVLEDLQPLPEPLDGAGEDPRRVGDGDAPVRVERAEADPGLLPLRGHVEDQGARPGLLDGAPLLPAALDVDRHLHSVGPPRGPPSSGANSS